MTCPLVLAQLRGLHLQGHSRASNTNQSKVGISKALKEGRDLTASAKLTYRVYIVLYVFKYF